MPGNFGVKLADFGMARQIFIGDYLRVCIYTVQYSTVFIRCITNADAKETIKKKNKLMMMYT
jgi:hypothetical protein